jgi:isochorismate synthase
MLLRETDGVADATFSCAAEDAAEALPRWHALLALSKVSRGGTPPRFTRQPAPQADLAFLARGAAALAAIEAGRFEKLVLTRSVRVTTDHALQAGPVLAALADQNPDCAVWAVARAGRIFLGASPERLLSYRHGIAEVDALAGTAWTAIVDEAPASLPLAGDKNRREHELVVASVREALAPLCEHVTVPAQAEVMCLHELSHLRRRIVGQARAEVSAFDLIARLHPTPAVGGTPTAAALDWLAAHGDRRGAWYTGGIGWLDSTGDADFAVALRCGLLAGREATLYAGAGFVAGSDPRQELAETEAKLSPMLAALTALPARARNTGT